jgi:hypothetical protein
MNDFEDDLEDDYQEGSFDYDDDRLILKDYIRRIEYSIGKIVGDDFACELWGKASDNYTAYETIEEIADFNSIETNTLIKKLCEDLSEKDRLSKSEIKVILSRIDDFF